MLLRLLYHNKYWRAICFSFLISCCINTANAQFFTLESNRNRVNLPFSFVRNMVIIKLKINNKGPFNFILDTGVGQMLITDPSVADTLGLVGMHKLKISGFGEGKDIEASITPEVKVTMKGISSHYVSAAILKKDIFGLSNYAGVRIHG